MEQSKINSHHSFGLVNLGRLATPPIPSPLNPSIFNSIRFFSFSKSFATSLHSNPQARTWTVSGGSEHTKDLAKLSLFTNFFSVQLYFSRFITVLDCFVIDYLISTDYLLFPPIKNTFSPFIFIETFTKRFLYWTKRSGLNGRSLVHGVGRSARRLGHVLGPILLVISLKHN